jgi:hypothetical protein
MTEPAAKHIRWLTAAVVAAACVPYLPTIRDYFTQDDFGVVQLLVRRPWTTFPRWFVMPWMEDIWSYTPDELRPFVAFTYQLTGKWCPARPELHHLFNVAMHAGNSLLVMAIARRVIFLSPAGAAVAGLVFALLPGQAESVAWITGRVDSMPAFFYFATFLAYALWRQHRGWRLYAAALALFFIALFSKQNTITMLVTLAAYDWIVLTSRERGALLSALSYWAPFALLTGGYLLLRRAVFGHSLRPGMETDNHIAAVATMVEHHVRRTVIGHLGPLSYVDAAIAAFLLSALVLIAIRSGPESRSRFLRAAGFFGVLWFAIGVAPVALAGYESPRHAYLASAGWAFMLAVIVDGLYGRLRSTGLRRAAVASVAAILVIYAVRLMPVVEGWRSSARISAAGVTRVQQEAAAAVPGTLIIVGAPRSSWEWSSPFMLGPPFSPAGLLERVRLVTPWRLHCCGREHWNDYTRLRIQGWSEAAPRPPIVALRFAPGTGAVSRLTDAEHPELGTIVSVLLQTANADSLDRVINDVLDRIVAGRPDSRRIPTGEGATGALVTSSSPAARAIGFRKQLKSIID